MSILRLDSRTLYYEARVALGINAVLPLLVLPAYGVAAVLRMLQGSPPDLSEIAIAFEVALPLSVGLAAAHLMSIERDEEFDTLRRSYPEPSWWLPLLRAGGVLVYAALSVLLTLGLLVVAQGEAMHPRIVLNALPPTLYLLAMALLLDNLTGTYWLAAGIVFAYWLLDLQTVGALTGPLYLFSATLPGEAINYALNRWLLVAAGTALLAANVAFSTWRRRRAGG